MNTDFEKIGMHINQERCKEHNIPAKFEVHKDTVKISCCCPLFLELMYKKFYEDLKTELLKNPEKM
jgi:iron only hydrogenase large subunit-like protein